MSQLNETWASLTQDERDEMNEKDRKGRIKSLAMKYGRRRVDAAQKEVESDAKRTGRNTKKRPITWRELQGRIENTKNTLKPGEVRRWDKEKGKWVSNKEDVDEAIALAPLVIPTSKLIGAGLAATGLTGMVLQSRKKKAEKEDLLGAVRKKQAEIQQDVANKETLEKNKEFQKKEKDRGKYVRRKQKPENQFVGEAAVLAAPAIANKVISTGAALWGMYNTINNNQGPGIKDGSGTQKGGVWDSLPKGRTTNKNLKGIANEVRKKMNKDKLKKTIEDLYGPIPEHVSWREKFKA